MTSNVTIIIPCFNEADSLPLLVRQISATELKYKFLLIDNGSTDETRKVLKNLELPSNVQTITKPENTGYGAGVKFGIANAKTPIVGWMHGDLQQDIAILRDAEITSLMNENGTDNLIAVKGLRSERNLIDTFFTTAVSVCASILFFRSCWDIAGQPNVYRKKDLGFLTAAPNDHNFEFFVYVTFKMKGGRYLRFPAPFKNRIYGSSSWDVGLTSKLKHSVRIFLGLLILRWKLLFNRTLQ